MFSESEALKIVDGTLKARRTPAIMLHLPYPPTDLPRLRSGLGGLPLLPDAFEWPSGCGKEGEVPLHFLAQIDCAELPRSVDPRMPDHGMLFFFGRDDEEQIWEDFKPKESARVIYAPEVPSGQQVRSPPACLPPIRGEFSKHVFPWLLPGDRGPSIHASWPVKPLRIDSWPEYPASDSPEILQTKDYREFYVRRAHALRVDAIAAATGISTTIDWKRDWERSEPAGPDPHAEPFPRAGIMIDRFARFCVQRVERLGTHPSWREHQERFG